jgi:hypothetical protein
MSMDAGALQRRIGGIVVTAGATDYEATRQEMMWNELRPDRRPELIVRVASEADVVAACSLPGSPKSTCESCEVLLGLNGDDPARQRELREAHRLFLEIGAPIRAAEVARELES